MEKLLDKSISQTDEAIDNAKWFADRCVSLEAERDRLREINKELVEALEWSIGNNIINLPNDPAEFIKFFGELKKVRELISRTTAENKSEKTA